MARVSHQISIGSSRSSFKIFKLKTSQNILLITNDNFEVFWMTLGSGHFDSMMANFLLLAGGQRHKNYGLTPI